MKLSNNHLKELIRLKQKKYRELEGKVLVEGYRLIEQLHKNEIEIEEIFISNQKKYDWKKITCGKVFFAEQWQLEKFGSTKTPSNIAGLVKIKTVPIKEKRFLLYLDQIKEPGNLGTIIRTATGAGISGIVISPDCCEIFNPKVIRASMGTVFSFPIEIHDQEWLKKQESKIIATTMENAENLFELQKFNDDIILVLGSEADGISKKIIEIADHKIKIPVSNKIESLNVSVSAGICIYFLKDLQS